MGAREIAETHQEFADDLTSGEDEGAAKQLDPVGLGQRVVPVEPSGEGAMRPAQIDQPLRIGDRGRDLEPIADDAGIAEQAVDVSAAETGDTVDIPAAEGGAESFPL